MFRPDPEGEALLRLAVVGVSAVRVREILGPRAGFDFARLRDLAEMNGVAPLLWRNLEAATDAVPAAVVDQLRSSSLRTCSASMIHAQRVARIVGLLEGEGIAVMPLKGSVAAADLFGDAGLYPTGDIDILVHPADLERSEAILGAAGYRPLEGMSRDDLVRAYHHLHLRDEWHILEIHWSLSRSHLKVAPEFWWEGARRIPFEGQTVLAMAPPLQLLHAAIHLQSHGFRPLKFWAWLGALIGRYGREIDPESLRRRATALRLGRLLAFVLTFARDRMCVDTVGLVPERPPRGYALFDGLVRSGLARHEVRANPRAACYACLINGAARMLALLGEKLFPSPAELRLRHGLTKGDRWWWLRYLSNPFRMAAGKR